MKQLNGIFLAFVALNLLTIISAAGLAETGYRTRHLSQYGMVYDSRLKCRLCYNCDDTEDEHVTVTCPPNGVCVKVVQKGSNKIFRDCGRSEMHDADGNCSHAVTFREHRVEGCIYVCDDEDECNAATTSISLPGQWKMWFASLLLMLSAYYYV